MVVNKTTLLRLLSSSKGGLWCQCHKETEFRQQKLVLLHPFNGHFSRKTWVSRYQNGRTSLDLNETRDDGGNGMAVASAGPYANNLHLAPDR